MMRLSLILFTLLLLTGNTIAQQVSINNFIVKEHLLKNNKLAIIAVDSADKPLEHINGTFLFSINGFEQILKFNDGIAVTPQAIEKSTFVYFKHRNELGTHSKLYYIIKKANDLNPVKISWIILVLIPLIIIIIATMFRKFILFGIIILVVLYFFNTGKGLAFPTFLETILDGLKALI